MSKTKQNVTVFFKKNVFIIFKVFAQFCCLSFLFFHSPKLNNSRSSLPFDVGWFWLWVHWLGWVPQVFLQLWDWTRIYQLLWRVIKQTESMLNSSKANFVQCFWLFFSRLTSFLSEDSGWKVMSWLRRDLLR